MTTDTVSAELRQVLRDLKLEEVASFAEFVTIYSVGPSPGRCD
ncbi:MAG TPA: hypothetical protein VK964_01300 [Nocardioidaceae bacterium]|nr:hypothetical protein [Nocardioidaceae bacterium]